ncbi:uncharacterized protein LOC113568554 [Electrophorus electricus]|uniref:uncharacterized protein LOC113568554 n=1 Tax=Electrophorus electricus TaxID=8005 RepID=UPI0015D0783D|nr:uncharacterized protein LOC113568554 [Electrophorus electricus]
MSFHGCHIAVMSNKAFCTVLIGLILRLMVCDAECENNFHKDITTCLFKDHWIAVKNFTPPAESEKDEHILLSVINTLCSTWKQNGERLKNECRNDARNCIDCLEKVMWTYGNILKGFARLNNTKETENITNFCENYTCKDSYTTYFMRPTDFVIMYNKICNGNKSLAGSIPECPKIQNSTTCSCIIKGTLSSEATHTTIPSTKENLSAHFSVPVPTTMIVNLCYVSEL